jgi:membrane dipeptidase
MTGADLDLPLIKKGGIDVQVYAFCAITSLGLPHTAEILKELDIILRVIESNPREVLLATSIEDVNKARKEGKLAVFLSLEGGEPILNEVGILRIFYRLGFRSMGLTWNMRNALADGGWEGNRGGGLSQFGKSVIKEMNHLGMLIDIAHMTYNGIVDTLQVSDAPIILSHGACGSLRPNHLRAYDDQVLEEIAKNGGVFCVTTIPEALAVNSQNANLSCYIDHIEHAIQIMGEDHVGLGADFDVYQSRLEMPANRWLDGLDEADKWPNVTAALFDRNFSESRIRKVMGENLHHLFHKVVG